MPALLFADAAASDAGWVLGAVSMVTTAVFGYLNNRLKVTTDAKLNELADDLADCKTQHDESERRHQDNARKIAALEAANAAERYAKHAAVNQKTALSYRLAFVEAVLRQLHPDVKIPVYVAPDDATDEHPTLPVAPKEG